MFKDILAAAAIALASSFTLTGTATAAPVDFTHDYGTNPGLVAPMYGHGGTMAPNYVTVQDSADNQGNRFYDEIDFSTAGFGAVNSLTLTFSIAGAKGSFLEDWRVYGSTNGGTSVADRAQIGSRLSNGSSWSYTLTSGSVFDQALSAGKLAFWFGDEGYSKNDFKLYTANVMVDGVAPIPLPAAGLLLIGSLGGFALLRRRGSDAPAA